MLRCKGVSLLVVSVFMGFFTRPSGAMPTIKKIGNTGITSHDTTNVSVTSPATQESVQTNRFVTMNSGIMSKMIKKNSVNIGNSNNNNNAVGGNVIPPQDTSSASSKDISTLSDRISELNTTLNEKQDALTPGDGIKIENNIISLSQEIANLPEKVDGINQEMATLNDMVGTVTGTDSNTFSNLQTNVANLKNDVAELQDTVGDTSMQTTAQTVTAAINELREAIRNLKLARNTYAAGVGVVIKPGTNDNDPPTIGLDLPADSIAGASYVFQPNNTGGGKWTQLEVQDSWNPGF